MRSKKAFTLVELLVVVGIIAVLVAILLPSLSKARAQAMTVQCQSNLRQLNVAIVAYSQDYQGNLPAPIPYGPGYIYYWQLLGPAKMLGQGETYSGAANGVRYKVLSCPAEQPVVCIGQPATEQPRRIFDNPWVPTSYMMNWLMTNGGADAKYARRTKDGAVYWGPASIYRKQRAEDVSFMMDIEILNWGWADFDFEWNVDAGFLAYPHGWRYYHAFRHPQQSANMLYYDGHVGQVYHYTKTGRYLFNYKFP